MPELPEVETLRRDLAAYLPGSQLVGVDVLLPRIFRPDPGLTAASIVGARIEAVWRRAKFLGLDLSDDLTLVFHLRLSGQLVLRNGESTLVAGGHPVPRFDLSLPHKSTHLIFDLEPPTKPAGGSTASPLAWRLYFTDIRQFGFCLLLRRARVTAYLGDQSLGPDALDPNLDLAAFRAILGRRRGARLKPLLLDQSTVAGLGNIYADETLYLARLHPLRIAGSLGEEESAKLLRSILAVLDYALTNGVAEVLNGRAVPGRGFPRAHGREGEPCLECGGVIVRIRVGGRSTYFCPTCQPASPINLSERQSPES